MRPSRFIVAAAVVAAGLALAAVSATGGTATPRVAASKPLVVWAVGDGPNPTNKRAAEVSAMIAAAKPADLLYLGDVYQTGSKQDFGQYYDPTYGKLASITYPTPGNHELESRPPLSGYDGYWKHKRPAVVGKGKLNLYATDLGMGWRLLDLTSSFVTEGSGPNADDTKPGPQEADVVNFVAADLAAHQGTCYIAMMHRPRFSAGAHGDQVDLAAIWNLLSSRTILLLQGHEHEYFRLNLDAVAGISGVIDSRPLPGAESLVVGTGGVQLSKTIDTSYPGLAAHLVAPSSKDKTKKKYYGALRLELSPGHADTAFINLDGKTIDTSSVSCTPVTG
jgi:hypothetical protein